MLHHNLATRPFYNDRAVRVTIAFLLVVAAAVAAFSVAQVFTLTKRNNELTAKAAADEAAAATLRDRAQTVRKSLDRADVSAVQAAAREANLLIEGRAFSWTDLFNRFEETLPDDVRIVAVQPQIDEEGRMLVAVTVIARDGESIQEFADALDNTGAFRGTLPRQEDVLDDGTYRAILQGYYGPTSDAAPAAVPPAPASESNRAPENASPTNATSGTPVPPTAPAANGSPVAPRPGKPREDRP